MISEPKMSNQIHPSCNSILRKTTYQRCIFNVEVWKDWEKEYLCCEDRSDFLNYILSLEKDKTRILLDIAQSQKKKHSELPYGLRNLM